MVNRGHRSDYDGPATERFEAATGIGVCHWEGKYWPRWGDALREAGYEPNTMQGRYDNLTVLRSFKQAIEKLGKWLARRELKMWSREHLELPSYNTMTRFDNRAEQARMMTEHTDELELSGQVLEICGEVPQPHHEEPDAGDSPPITTGYVYLIKSGRHYKIGRSNDPSRRAYEIRLQMPEKVEVVHEIETDDPDGIEAYWHRRFVEKRANGEWFSLSKDDVKAFRIRKTM